MIKSENDFVVLEFDLPEFKKEDVKVTVKEDNLNIKAKAKEENSFEEDDFNWFEKSAKSFDYSCSLPLVDPTEKEVDFRDGNLKITIPKK